MTRFQPDPSLPYPGYLFTEIPEDQLARLTSATQAASSASPDITLLSSDGSLIHTSKLLLSLHSPFLSHLLSSDPVHSCLHTTVNLPDCSTASLNNLISLLTSGRGVSRYVGSDYRPASHVIDTGNLLGVRFGSLDYEVARRETVKESQNIESNKEAFDRVNQSIESSNVEDTDVEGKSVHSHRSKMNQSQTYEQSNGENNIVIDQQNSKKKIDNSIHITNEDQDKAQNKNSSVEEKKGTKKSLSNISKYPLGETSSSGASQENKSTLKMSSSNTVKDKSSYSIQCDTCGKTCKSKQGLQLHMKCHHSKPVTGVIFTCSTCGKLFKSRKGWQVHERDHDAKNWNNFLKQTSPVQLETEGIQESLSIPILKKNKVNKTKRKNAALQNKTSKSSLKKMKIESKGKSVVPSGNKKDETGQNKVRVEDEDIGNKKYGIDKVSTEIVSNDRANNNIAKTRIQKETTNTTMEKNKVMKSCSSKNNSSRSMSKRSRLSFGCSNNYEIPKAKIRERTVPRSSLKNQSNLSTVDPAESAEGIFKNLEDEAEGIFKNLENEKFRRNLINQISQSTDINSFQHDDSSDKNTSKTFKESKGYKKKTIGMEKAAKPDRPPLSDSNELVMSGHVRGRSRVSRQKSIKGNEDHLDFEWEDDLKISSEDEDGSPVRSPSESLETLNNPRTDSQVDSEPIDNSSVPYVLANSQSTPIAEQGNFFPSSNEISDIDTSQFEEPEQSFDLDLFQ